MILRIVSMTNEIIEAKATGADPQALGRTMAQLIPPEHEERILTMLDRDDWFSNLSGINPKVREHAEFFLTFRNALLAEFPEDDGEDDDGGDDGDDGDGDNSGDQG